MLTRKQLNIYNTIKEYINNERISPTVRELCDLVGLKSTSTMHNHLKQLEEKGYITKKKESPRSIKIEEPEV